MSRSLLTWTLSKFVFSESLHQVTDSVPVPTSGPIEASVRPPGSKSITNRALVCAALANGKSVLSGALDSEDTRVMVDCLAKLGIQTEADWQNHQLIVHGTGAKIPNSAADLFVENSGTTIRFVTAMCALGSGQYRLDGIARMRERPIGDLIEALGQLGVQTKFEMAEGCPPLVMQTDGLPGGQVSIRGNISSQYLSGILMSLPMAQNDSAISVDGELVSKPYIEITKQVIASFGGQIDADEDYSSFRVPGGQVYQAQNYSIEPDASAASYFWAAAAITKGRVKVLGLTRESLQGDVAFVDCLKKMGCLIFEEADGITVQGSDLIGIDVDMNAISDTVQTLAAVALFAKGPTRVRGVAHNRHKETDRIADLATELRRVGAEVNEFEDGLEIIPGELRGAQVETYNDHRMAMSLALVGLRVPGIEILNPGCTRKTYPKYFEDLAAILKT